jgi:hypothetical protein
MKSNREQPKPTAEGGTIEADGGGGEMIAVARAQRELIDTLARLVLAAVEREQQHDAASDSPTLGSAGAVAQKARGTRAAGARRGGGDRDLDTALHGRRAEDAG